MGWWIAAWPQQLITLIWFAWVISWVVASLWSARTQKRVTSGDSRPYRFPIIGGALLLLLLTPRLALPPLTRPLWNLGDSGVYAFAALIVAGLLFAWWARIHLGSFWSHAITRKEGHQVVDTGPYRYVRHPIYTGLIVGILATGAAVATIPALLGAALITFGLWRKARIEEHFLSAELGAEAYGAYCRRVPMLVPFMPR